MAKSEKRDGVVKYRQSEWHAVLVDTAIRDVEGWSVM